MIKNIIALIILVSCLPVWAAQSDGAPKEVPLASVAQLKAYAVTKINWLSGGISGQSISGTTWFSVPYSPADGDPVAIAAALKRNRLTFSVDPTERISSFANWEVRMPDGATWTAFYGQRDFSLVKAADGSYTVPAEAAKLDEMEFLRVPFPVANVSNAYIVVRDAAGNQTGTHNLGDYGNVRNGYLVLFSEYTNQNGELHIQFGDNSKTIYGLPGGKIKATTSASTNGFDTAPKGVRTLADNTLDIAFRAADEVIRARYLVESTVIVRFDPTVALPTKVNVVEESVFKADPNAPGLVFDPSKVPVTWKASAGKVYLVLFTKPSPPIYTGGGKG